MANGDHSKKCHESESESFLNPDITISGTSISS